MSYNIFYWQQFISSLHGIHSSANLEYVSNEILNSKVFLLQCQLFNQYHEYSPWWRNEIFSALLALCAGNSPVTSEFPSQRSVTRSFDIFFDLPLSKQSWGWWFEKTSRPLWCQCNAKSRPWRHSLSGLWQYDTLMSTRRQYWRLSK